MGRANSNSGKPRRAAIRSGLGTHLRIHAADFLPRWYVLRDLGLARKKSARIKPPSSRLMMLTSPWRLSLLFLVSGVADGLSLRASGHARVLGQALCPIAGSTAIRYGGHRSAAVISRGRRETLIRRYIRRLPAAVLHAYHGFCHGSDCLALPTWNPPLVRPILVGLHRGFVRRHPPCPHIHQLAARVTDSKLGGLGIVVWPLAFLAIARITMISAYPLHSRARRRLVQPCHLRNDVPTRVLSGRHTCALADDRTRALDRTGVSRSKLGFSMRLPRFLQPG